MPLHHPRHLAALALRDITPSPSVHGSHVHVVLARSFSASRVLRDDRGPHHDDQNQNHYEALNVSPNASHADIKKSFYTLSKTHHPDHNPSDPTAGSRFMRISEAYAVLGHADKRAAYDRDVMASHHRHAPPSRGSPYASGPAGGRPASGLSRRRGTFRGPPPSFYRSGGWGAYAAKRRAAHEESAACGGDGSTGLGSRASAAAEGGAGQTVPHFDAEAHERTGRWVDERIMAKRRADGHGGPGAPFVSEEMGHTAAFLVVSSLLVVGLVLPAVIIDAMVSREADKKQKSARAE